MENNNRNTILAVALSILVLIGWNFFYIAPRLEEERKAAEITAQREAVQTGEQQAEGNQAIPQSEDSSNATAPEASSSGFKSEEQALAESPRVEVTSELLSGSINLKGARFDDLKLNQYRETIDDESPLIQLLKPSGSREAYFAEFGFTPNKDLGELPGPSTEWKSSSSTLSAGGSVTLDWTNPSGIKFERSIALDDKYMFTITDKVTNTTGNEIQITPYGRIARFGQPDTENIFVLHEGLIGVFGEDGLQEVDYSDLVDEVEIKAERTEAGWIGITDKYWATAIIPGKSFKPRFAYYDDGVPLFQSDFIGERSVIAAGGTSEIQQRLFAGAKKSAIIDGYEQDLGILKFELLIDWGWFHFITKPLFGLLNWLYDIVGNFGVAILMATVIIKAAFFYFANLSYASMAKMKKVQPEMMEIRERYQEDRMKQQQEIMALYKKEKINPAAGCWPVLIQIPVFFALYKVLYVTIEMRQAPFFGWIQDLAAPDPSSVWNLFGLLPYEPSTFLPAVILLGIWPIIMGVSMFVQMQMNPAPPDPTQAMIFKWMPVVFTFMLSTFPAGLVIYWAWNNTLSIIQQGFIMRRHGTKIELLDNLKSMFSRKPKEN